MSTLTIAVIAIAVGVPLLIAILFKTLWRVPAADQALIVTGLASKGAVDAARTFKIITGGGAFVIPALQKAQYLSLQADKAILDVGRRLAEDPGRRARGGHLQGGGRLGLDHERRHPLPARPGDEAGRRLADARPGARGVPRSPALDHRRADRRGPDRQPQRAGSADARGLERRDAEARPRGGLAPDPGDRR